jgi:KipI family sensor histidine kinase inhibitor
VSAPVVAYGPAAWLVELDDVETVLAATVALRAGAPADVELVPAARTVLVRCPRDRHAAVREWLDATLATLATLAEVASSPRPARLARGAALTIPVIYDGIDLADVAAATGFGVDEVVERHTAARYRVAFCGFAPGFAYLIGLDPALRLPRRATPRTRVPAGSVAIAAEYSAVYPAASPGGWHLLGRVDPADDPHVWDLARPAPALLTPGTEVRFTAARRRRPIEQVAAPTLHPGVTDPSPGAIEVVDPGWASTIQDLGRPGQAVIGVGRSGALDGETMNLVNRLVGNPPDAAVLETAGGLLVRATAAVLVASSDHRGPIALAPGDVARVDPAPGCAWGYLAVRGGVAVDAVLGSRSHDTLSGVGPAPLVAGTVLAVGDDPTTPVAAVDVAPRRPSTRPIRLWPGPRRAWFAAGVLDALVAGPWRVGVDTDRVGMRLEGPVLRRRRDGELPSEGLVAGAVQVPPDGRPVVMLRDHPTTGGYPVIAVVDPDDVSRLAQCRPGDPVRFAAA